MYIHNSYNFMFAHRQFNIQQNKMSKALQRLSSGYRINSAADDPAGLGISERMRAQITQLNQAARNARDGQDMLNTADGALDEAHRILNRLADISTQASNGTLGQTERTALQMEAGELIKELDRIGKATQFAGQPLLDGKSDPAHDLGKVVLQVGTTANSYDQIALKMPNMKTALAMLDGIDLMTVEGANAALTQVKGAIGQVSEMRGYLGAQTNRLDYTINSLEVMAENLTEAESRIRDADMAQEMMNFVKASVQSQAAQLMMVHAMQEPYRVLDMIKASAP